MSKYNHQALKGYLLCLKSQRKSAKTAYNCLVGLTGGNIWTLEDVKAFYAKIRVGEYALEDENSVKGFIFCLHRRNTPLKAVHAIIKRLKQDVKFDEVKSVYKKINENEYDMKDFDPKLLLENMPRLVKDIIGQQIGLKSRLILRKQCKKLRSTIDNGHFTLERLSISFFYEMVCIHDDDGSGYAYDDRDFDVTYSHEGNECEVEESGKRQVFDNPSTDAPLYLVMAAAELKLILGSNKNLKIQKLVIGAKEGGESEMASTIENALKGCATKPKVQKIQAWDCGFHDVLTILQHLDPSEINHLDINHMDYEVTCPPDVQTIHNHIFALEQWKNLKTFVYRFYVYCMNVAEAFSNFNYVTFDLKDPPTYEHLEQLKKTLLKNQDLDEFQIHTLLTEQKRDEFRNDLQATSAFQTWSRWNAKHEVPAPGKKTLSVCIKNNMIWFKGPAYTVKDRRIEKFADSWITDRKDERWFHFYY